MTFSLVARCRETGRFGVAISSSSPAVAARCAYTRAGVGAVASQNVTDPRLGPRTLDLMAQGLSAQQAVETVTAEAPHIAYRQILAIGHEGPPAIFSGPNSLGIWSDAAGSDVISAGNLLAHAEVPQAIVDGFDAAAGELGDRLIAAMQAGLAAGGEAGPVHSAGCNFATRCRGPWLTCAATGPRAIRSPPSPKHGASTSPSSVTTSSARWTRLRLRPTASRAMNDERRMNAR